MTAGFGYCCSAIVGVLPRSGCYHLGSNRATPVDEHWSLVLSAADPEKLGMVLTLELLYLGSVREAAAVAQMGYSPVAHLRVARAEQPVAPLSPDSAKHLGRSCPMCYQMSPLTAPVALGGSRLLSVAEDRQPHLGVPTVWPDFGEARHVVWWS